jgi:hypothetical protein
MKVVQRSNINSAQSPPSANEDGNQAIEVKMAGLMETVSKAVLLFVAFYFLLAIPQFLEFSQFMRERQIVIYFTEYLWIIPGVAASFLLNLLSTRVIVRWFEPLIKKDSFRAAESYEERLARLGNYIYGVIYYTISTVALMSMTFGSEFSPVSFGGSLNTTDKIIPWPYDVSYGIRIFYMLTMGHHLERTLHELMHQYGSKTFFVMMLHHILTLMLIFLSFFMRQLVFGIPVLLTHDVNDIFLNASRFLRETNYKGLTNVCFITLLISWIYTRIYTFPVEVIYGAIYQAMYDVVFIQRFLFSYIFFLPALIALYILNVYWGFQMLKIAILRIAGKEKLPFEDAKKKVNS